MVEGKNENGNGHQIKLQFFVHSSDKWVLFHHKDSAELRSLKWRAQWSPLKEEMGNYQNCAHPDHLLNYHQ